MGKSYVGTRYIRPVNAQEYVIIPSQKAVIFIPLQCSIQYVFIIQVESSFSKQIKIE